MYPADDALEFMEYRPYCDHIFNVKIDIYGYLGSDLYYLTVFACGRCGAVDDSQE